MTKVLKGGLKMGMRRKSDKPVTLSTIAEIGKKVIAIGVDVTSLGREYKPIAAELVHQLTILNERLKELGEKR